MAQDAADLTTALLSTRHTPQATHTVLAEHLATHPHTYTRDVSVAACGLVRILHMLSHEVEGVEAVLDTTLTTSTHSQEEPA